MLFVQVRDRPLISTLTLLASCLLLFLPPHPPPPPSRPISNKLDALECLQEGGEGCLQPVRSWRPGTDSSLDWGGCGQPGSTCFDILPYPPSSLPPHPHPYSPPGSAFALDRCSCYVALKKYMVAFICMF